MNHLDFTEASGILFTELREYGYLAQVGIDFSRVYLHCRD
ncbi:hypothetical protein ACPOL_3593 [Acidisarcina polymorpha]|uniref:Uncharacterized protein n=1 Tax=Acidisarcina polymorpha TaxID=2211140 RepID=A0A2Z5G1B8_9BACT|nr:hypothetical protein ACPOL_3593 [Acidisarcina polymorpha]